MQYCGECKNFIYECMAAGYASGNCLKYGHHVYSDTDACKKEQLRSAVEDIEAEGKYHG